MQIQIWDIPVWKYKKLNETKPKNILELNLGNMEKTQSTPVTTYKPLFLTLNHVPSILSPPPYLC